jgi:hypothetical protein
MTVSQLNMMFNSELDENMCMCGELERIREELFVVYLNILYLDSLRKRTK